MTQTTNSPIKTNSKFVACWGYDQTQYSIYNVVSVKGKTVFVTGLNSWSNFSESDLAVGSTVKVFTFKRWEHLSDEERADYERRNFDRNSYQHHMGKEAEAAAKVSTIVKMNRIDGESWSYVWVLDDGRIVSSKDNYQNDVVIKIISGLKKCIVNTKYGQPSIKIDQSITAYLDDNYDQKKQSYRDQNEYTAYNGR